MTEEDIKEALSNNYVATLANRLGYELVSKRKDYGVDCTIKYQIARKMANNQYAYIDAPYSCDLQLKATTEKSITRKKNCIIYDMRVKNYNDLIYRKQIGFTPLVFILFILPTDEQKWINIFEDELIISKNAYWYYPSDKENTESENISSRRIKIPI